MAKRGAFQRVITDLQDRYGQAVAEAFLKAIEDIRSTVRLQDIIARIEARDIEGALDALNLDPAAFNDMADKIREAYTEGGKATAANMPKRLPDGTALIVRFDGRNPVAEAFLREHSSQLITRTTADMRQAARQALTASFERGDNPRRAALDLVGRINRATGKRDGGILGLSGPQEGYVQSAREELASSDPADLRRYLERQRRDKRFDRSVRKAIREGKTLSPDIAGKASTAYERRLLQLRGEVIGKNEVFSALAESKDEAFRQAVEAGKIQQDTVTLTWRHFTGDNPRVQHVAMNGKTVKLGQKFTLPDGTQMRFAHDPDAPISHNAGCGCQTDYSVNFYAGLR